MTKLILVLLVFVSVFPIRLCKHTKYGDSGPLPKGLLDDNAYQVLLMFVSVFRCRLTSAVPAGQYGMLRGEAAFEQTTTATWSAGAAEGGGD